MTALATRLHHEIATKGPLTVSGYMRTCLMDETDGYYTTKAVFGAAGDFITAPEISQLFGEMLAAFQAHIHQLFGSPAQSIIFEAGPGKGTLMADMQRTYQKIASPLASAPIYLLEQSQALQAEQTQKLAPQKPHFIASLEDLPAAPIFGIANEFFDALGVDQAVFHKGAWHERLITSDGTEFSFTIGDQLEDLAPFSPLPETAHEGDIMETSPVCEQLMRQLATHISRYGGALLVIDYGKSDNLGDSLQAVRNHKPSDVLSHQGESDITHWVDFQALSATAAAHEARFIGPIGQGRFLTDLGIGTRAEALRRADDPEGDRALLAAIDRLTSPAHMGHAFKVGLLVPKGEGLPPGFTSLNIK